MKNAPSALLAALALSACANEAPTTTAARKDARLQPKAPLGVTTTVRAEVPIKVRWEEVTRSPHRAVVRATVERVLGIDTPFDVRVELPPGVTVARGRTAFTLTPNVEAVVVQEELELEWAELPPTDAQLHVAASTGTMGYTATVPWRFGRPEPTPAAPAATGPHLRLGDRDLGPSVPLK